MSAAASSASGNATRKAIDQKTGWSEVGLLITQENRDFLLTSTTTTSHSQFIFAATWRSMAQQRTRPFRIESGATSLPTVRK